MNYITSCLDWFKSKFAEYCNCVREFYSEPQSFNVAPLYEYLKSADYKLYEVVKTGHAITHRYSGGASTACAALCLKIINAQDMDDEFGLKILVDKKIRTAFMDKPYVTIHSYIADNGAKCWLLSEVRQDCNAQSASEVRQDCNAQSASEVRQDCERPYVFRLWWAQGVTLVALVVTSRVAHSKF